MGCAAEMLRAENIRFYSGRKFWKTLMASDGLGRDAEEYFMGIKCRATWKNCTRI